ncbi:hypothetical protein HPB48_008551 [Haemaphysalis longicornis]|uniref:Uncharacterized protein n=1 Tax=Haemaphysalis longicornis TaxID=44386 RepID=A0A9J6GMR8_HAELO|nr:hypothetical protein HPB48_008551 [Haemaphysalis longicornis]
MATPPSMVSSGYGSQALSSTPLSSEDSGSLRSVGGIEDPGTPDLLDPKTCATGRRPRQCQVAAALHISLMLLQSVPWRPLEKLGSSLEQNETRS